MTDLERLGQDIEEQLDGIKIQWRAIVQELDDKKRSILKDQVFANMDIVSEMMRKHSKMQDEA